MAKQDIYDIRLDNKGDIMWVEKDGGLKDIQLITGAERVAQNVRIALSIFKGEYHYDSSVGVPLLAFSMNGTDLDTFLTSSRVNDEVKRNIITQIVTDVEGVAYISNITIDADKQSGVLKLFINIITEENESAVIDYISQF